MSKQIFFCSKSSLKNFIQLSKVGEKAKNGTKFSRKKQHHHHFCVYLNFECIKVDLKCCVHQMFCLFVRQIAFILIMKIPTKATKTRTTQPIFLLPSKIFNWAFHFRQFRLFFYSFFLKCIGISDAWQWSCNTVSLTFSLELEKKIILLCVCVNTYKSG